MIFINTTVMRLFAHDVSSLARTEDIKCDEDVGFEVFNLSNNVLRGLEAIGFKRPSPVQLRAIPYGRCGVDMVVQSKAGTGKTCVFSVIALDTIDVTKGLQVVILAPTHEIAIQDSEVVQAIGRKIQNLVVATSVGGHHDEKKKLKSCHIIVGSPGRVKYLIEKSKLPVQSVRLFILDEADFLVSQEKMRADVNWICSALPIGRQTIALSATFSTLLSEYVTNYMNNPVHIKMCPKTAVLIGVQQFYHYVGSAKFDGSYSAAKFAAVKEILTEVTFRQCIIFYNNHEKADQLAKELVTLESNPNVGFISSHLDPTERSSAFNQFRQGKFQILVSSDLICRGADAKDVDLVIHLDFPRSVDTYLHRVGRAGRFGGHGVSIGIVALSQEFDLIQKYQERLNIQIPQLDYPPRSDLIQSSHVEMPSCRVGDVVTADQIETKPTTGESSTPKVAVQAEASKPAVEHRSIVSYDDEAEEGFYSDMMASYGEVDRFLNMDPVSSTPACASLSSTSFGGKYMSKQSSMAVSESTPLQSEMSQLAQGYQSVLSKPSPDVDMLAKAYDTRKELELSSPQNLSVAHESRSASAATIVCLKEMPKTPCTPSPVLTKKLCNKSIQTDEQQNSNCFGSNLPELNYIPMPPLMTAGGYSAFAEWLQLHGSLAYNPRQMFQMQHSCNCSCHQ